MNGKFSKYPAYRLSIRFLVLSNEKKTKLENRAYICPHLGEILPQKTRIKPMFFKIENTKIGIPCIVILTTLKMRFYMPTRRNFQVWIKSAPKIGTEK